MAYVGFDLDETLGRFSVANSHTFFLQPHIGLYGGVWSGLYGTGTQQVDQPFPLSPDLKTRLDDAFRLFVKCIAEKERQQPPLGLIRPSMITLVKQLYELKQVGAVKAVVIYSNNGNLSLLHLAGHVLETLADAPGLFCNYVHWYHPLRKNEVVPGNPGAATKTLAILKKAFQTGLCTPAEISDEDVYFFDDLDPPHRDLHSKLASRYIQVTPYKYDAMFKPITECLMKAIQTSDLVSNPDYFSYIDPLIGHDRSLAGILTFLSDDEKAYRRRLIKPNNARLSASTRHLLPSARTFSRSLSTLRRLETKQNLGTPLTPEEQHELHLAERVITLYEQQNPTAENNAVLINTTMNGGGRRRRSTTKKSRRQK